MKRIACSILFAVASAVACAGVGSAEAEMAVALPQPCTILICAAGAMLVFGVRRVS